MSGRELVTLTRAAKMLGRSRSTVAGWVERGVLHPEGLDLEGNQLVDLRKVRDLADATPTRRKRRRDTPPTAQGR